MRFNVSEINELIRDRRTIFPEQFSKRKVHKELIEVLLENARWAPTHKLTQPWHFTVFTDDGLQRFANFHAETYKNLSEAKGNFNENKYNKLKERPLLSSAIIVAAMKRSDEGVLPEVEEIAAASCAIQNMFLTATAYGLGFYWGTGGLTYTDEMKSFLGLNERDKVLGILHIGYPAVEWPAKTKRNLREEHITWNTTL